MPDQYDDVVHEVVEKRMHHASLGAAAEDVAKKHDLSKTRLERMARDWMHQDWHHPMRKPGSIIP